MEELGGAFRATTKCDVMSETAARPSRRRRTNAAGSSLGSTVQEFRVATHLFQASEGARVSLEVVADTAVHRGRHTRAEEHKNRTSRHNPIGDTSVDLWKTLRNWVDAARDGILLPEHTTYVLHVSREFPGDLAREFANANDARAARAATERARAWLLPLLRRDARQEGDTADDELPAGTRPHIEAIFAADDGAFEAIVERFVLEFGSGDVWQDLRAAARAHFFDPDVADVLLERVVGWVKRTVTACIEQGRPAVVEGTDFAACVRATRRQLDQHVILKSAVSGPDAATVEAHLGQAPTYLRQLKLIDLHDEEAWEAAIDFLRASNMRADWGKRGLVQADGFEAYERELTGTWRRGRRQVALDYVDATAEQRGQRLFDLCCSSRVALEGQETPGVFCRGSFHTLADQLVVGWHPDYRILLPADAPQPRRRRRAGSGGA